METAPNSSEPLAASTKRLARRFFIIVENRLELLLVEIQEARERLVHAILLALGVAAFGLLALLTLTAAIVVLLWPYAPWLVLLVLTALYGTIGVYLYRQLMGTLRDWQNLPATLDQLKKDRACLERIIE